MTDTLLTQNQAREAVYLQWKTEWEILHSQTVGQPTYLPYQFENLRFVEPASPQRWVRVSVRHLSSDQETIASSGNRRYQRNAQVWVQAFGAIGSGLGDLDDLIQESKDILEGKNYGGIHASGSADPQEVGEDGRWYEVVLIVPITYYEKK